MCLCGYCFLESAPAARSLRLALLQNQLRHHLADRRAVLEAVPRAAADDPHIFHRRMPVDDEVTVGSLLVLADAGLDQRRVFQGREAEANIFANVFQRFRTDHALAIGGIEGRAARVVGDLESAAVAARDAVAKASAVIGPHWQMRVAEAIISGRRAKEKDILLGGLHQIADGLREQLPEPRPAGEDVAVGLELASHPTSARLRSGAALQSIGSEPRACRYLPPAATNASTTAWQLARASRYPHSGSKIPHSIPSKLICGQRFFICGAESS